MFAPHGFDLKCIYNLRDVLLPIEIDPTTSLAKVFLIFGYSVADCFALWLTQMPYLLSSSPCLFLVC